LPETALQGPSVRWALGVEEIQLHRAAEAVAVLLPEQAFVALDRAQSMCLLHTFSRHRLDFQFQTPFSWAQEDEAGVAS
jgi:hypothetical protein